LCTILTPNDSWKEKDLSWKLIRAITDDPITKQGLFPSPGANVSTTKGGGLSKAYHHKELAAKVFSDHPVYGPAYAQAKSASEKSVWANKVKNRIQMLVKPFSIGVELLTDYQSAW
jgi:hypothetical protein